MNETENNPLLAAKNYMRASLQVRGEDDLKVLWWEYSQQAQTAALVSIAESLAHQAQEQTASLVGITESLAQMGKPAPKMNDKHGLRIREIVEQSERLRSTIPVRQIQGELLALVYFVTRLTSELNDLAKAQQAKPAPEVSEKQINDLLWDIAGVSDAHGVIRRWVERVFNEANN